MWSSQYMTLLGEGILWWELDKGKGLIWGCGFVPHHTHVLGGVVLEGCVKLDLVPPEVRHRVRIARSFYLETFLT